MRPELIVSLIAGYFGILILISWLTSRNAADDAFYLGNRQAPWYIVSFGMIGATLSGITFISVPGTVGNLEHINGQFSYLQVIIGYVLGYWVIAFVLLPLYYRLNLTSIYGYLEQRFGYFARKTGASFFLTSRVIGASFRLYVVAIVMDQFIFKTWGIPFWFTVAITILLIWVYTFKSGIKTIIWTDTFQTLFMLTSVVLTVIYILRSLDLHSVSQIRESFDSIGIKQTFFWDNSGRNFYKQFFSGFFLAIVMTGLDQDMMQKNLSCRNVKEAKTNMLTLSGTMTVVNTFFVIFGALLYVYANKFQIAIPENRDLLFPTLALNHFSVSIGIMFILGLIAAAYSSADSALTALTTSFVIDILDFESKGEKPGLRRKVHIGFSLLLFTVIVIFGYWHNDSVITQLFKISGLTYGPLLGLFLFGIVFKHKPEDKIIPWICVGSAIISGILMFNDEYLFGNKIGFEILVYNAMITFAGLYLASVLKGRNPAIKR
ncbi:MAG: sodium:solute symporter [Bacteroidetes bacterium]|nr:sodium:solute symporter [Bacteroidota bacterium]